MAIRTLLVSAVLLLAPPAHADDPKPALEPVLAELTKDPLFTKSDVGVQIIDLDSGEVVFARNDDTPLSPASTTKVLTAATALKTLGPAYRFHTVVLADAPPDAEGVVAGNLYVKGGGDPSMVIEKLWKLVADLELAGVRTIEGDLVFDDSFFAADTSLRGWDKPADVARGPSYFPKLSALSLNFNTVSIAVRPGGNSGDEARVALETDASPYVELESTVKTGAKGGRRGIRIVREVRDDGGMTFKASGSIPAGGDLARYYRTVDDPTAHFAAAFVNLVADAGIGLSGSPRRGPAPEEAVELASMQSRSLAALLMDMNKFSSNFFAEQVLRTVGAEVEEVPGSTDAGLKVVDRYLRSLGLDESDYKLVNGSGLSRDARLSPAALNAVLLDMHHDDAVGPEFEASLAIAGWDGTLSGRLEENPGALRGKTGTIGGVHCLAGYVTAGSGDRYAFAFLVNKVSGGLWRVRALHDRFARRLFEHGDESVADGAEQSP